MDYSHLSRTIIKKTYHLPCADKSIDRISTEKRFRTLEASNNKWCILNKGEDRNETTFECHAGLVRNKRMIFDLTNAPDTPQRAMDVILSGIKSKMSLFYFNVFDVILIMNEEKLWYDTKTFRIQQSPMCR